MIKLSEKLYITTLKNAGMFEEFKLNNLTFEAIFEKKNIISVFDTNLIFEEGSLLERPLVNDLKEFYIIKEVNFDKGAKGHIPASWCLKIVKPSEAETKQNQPIINVHNYQNVQGQMIASNSSIQNNNNMHEINNISKVIDDLLENIKSSQLDLLDKEDLEEILNRLNKFSNVENKSTIVTRAKTRLDSLNSLLMVGISTGKLAPQVIDIYSKIKAYFTSL